MCFILDSLQSRKTKIKVIRRANQVNLERLIRIITIAINTCIMINAMHCKT